MSEHEQIAAQLIEVAQVADFFARTIARLQQPCPDGPHTHDVTWMDAIDRFAYLHERVTGFRAWIAERRAAGG